LPEEPDQSSDPAGQPRDSGRGDWTRALREAAPYLGIGSSAAASVALGLAAGYWLDGKLGTRPLLFLLGGVFGILAAFWQVYKLGGMGRKP
jgi:F0F1-type ATP synthase assembly protein I